MIHEKKYNEYVSYLLSNKLIKPEDDVTITRDILIDFISSSFNEANMKYSENKDISKSFKIFGLNPFCLDDGVLKKHLKPLDKNKSYDSLLKNQEPANCITIDPLMHR